MQHTDCMLSLDIQKQGKEGRDQIKPPRRSVSASFRQRSGWRASIFGWAILTLFILLANIFLLIGALVHHSPYAQTASGQAPSGTTLLFEGNCDKTAKIRTWTHLVLNVASSLLLTASTSCMQVIASPTRSEIENAHLKRDVLDIGVLSISNIRSIPWKRSAIWVALAISSVPLHLFFNSVIVSSTTVNDILTVLTVSDFGTENLSPASLNETDFKYLTEFESGYIDYDFEELITEVSEQRAVIDIIRHLDSYPPNSDVHILNRTECLRTFSEPWIWQYKSLALVTNLTSELNIIGATISDSRFGIPQDWTCSPLQDRAFVPSDILNACDISSGVKNRYLDNHTSYYDPWNLDHCIAQSAAGRCTVELSSPLLGVVIFANLVKLLAMVHTLRIENFEPIVTVGDAIDSFIRYPDLHTASVGALSWKQFVKAKRIRGSYLPLAQTKKIPHLSKLQITHDEIRYNYTKVKERRRWFSAISGRKWLFTLSSLVALQACVVFVLIYFGFTGQLKEPLQQKFGDINLTFSYLFEARGIIIQPLLSNMPQLILSIAYVLFYGILASMLLVSEVADFAHHRKAVRVTNKRQGQQRSSYWLTVPYRYALPLLVGFSIWHWMISQSLFTIRLNQVDITDDITYAVRNGLGYSPVAILVSFLWGLVLLGVLLSCALRRLPGGMPILGSSSLAIAAACHPDPQEPSDASMKPLLYGVLPSIGANGERRAGFSSLEVCTLSPRENYGSQCLVELMAGKNFHHPCEHGALWDLSNFV